MYAIKKFDEGEAEYSVLLRRKLEEAEAMLLKLNPSRERSLALTKLDETLLWANVAIAAAGISTDREGSAASEAAEQSWAMMSAPVMKKEVRAVSPGRTFLNNKKLQEAVDDALLNAKANGALKEAQVRAARIAEPAEHEFFRMEKVEKLLDPENAICVSAATHKAIHYGTGDGPKIPDGNRTAGDTCPWRK